MKTHNTLLDMKMQKMIKADCNTNYTLNEAALQVPLQLFGKTCALEKVNRNSKATVNSTKFSCDTLPHLSICAGVVLRDYFNALHIGTAR